jgi:hypothetical protein
MERLHLAQELGPRHAGHALVDEEEGDGSVARGQFARGVERLGSRPGLHDTIVRAILPPQVTIDRGQDGRIVVDGKDDGLGHCRIG